MIKKLVHEETGIEVEVLNEIQEAAFLNEGFKEVTEDKKKK